MNYLAFDELPHALPVADAPRTGYALAIAEWLALVGAGLALIGLGRSLEWRQAGG